MGNLEDAILYWLTLYKVPTTFVGSFFFGETVILTAAVLTFKLGWSITAICAAAFLGTITSDFIWYGLGKKILKRSEARNSGLYIKYKKHFDTVNRMVPSKRPFMVLLYFKFLYGTRIVTLLYLSMHKISLKKLVIFETIGTALWLTTLMIIAFLSTAGVYSAIRTFHEYTLILTAIVVALIITKIFSVWITKRTEKE